MNGILKSVQSILISLIILALIGTGIILWYNRTVPAADTETSAVPEETAETAETESEAELPTATDDAQLIDTASTGQHVHSYQSSTVTQPTCTRTGLMRYTCECGDFYTDTIAALDHKEGDWIVVQPATREKDGYKQKRCVRCNIMLKEEVIDKSTVSGNSNSGNSVSSNDHVHYYKAEVTTEPTCTVNGERTYTCTCGSTYVASVPALNHPSRRTEVKEATCTEAGSVETTCDICSAVISHDTLPKLNHEWSKWKTTKYPTSEEDGTEERTCDLCGEKEERTLAKLQEGVNHTHSYTASVTKAANCTDAGTTTYTCTCGDTYTDTIAALGHNPGNWTVIQEPTASSPGLKEQYCRRCGALVGSEDIPYEETCSHNYESVIRRESTCQRAGTRVFTCSKCGDSYEQSIDKIPHKYVIRYNPDGTELGRFCSMCDEADPSYTPPSP